MRATVDCHLLTVPEFSDSFNLRSGKSHMILHVSINCAFVLLSQRCNDKPTPQNHGKTVSLVT